MYFNLRKYIKDSGKGWDWWKDSNNNYYHGFKVFNGFIESTTFETRKAWLSKKEPKPLTEAFKKKHNLY